MWIAFAIALVSWTAANVLLLRALRQVNRNLALDEHPFPAAADPRFCFKLWKQHRRYFPGSSLRANWLANYVVCGLALIAGFTMLIRSR